MKCLITLLLCLTIHRALSEKVRYDNYKLFRLTPTKPEAVQALIELQEAALSEYNFWGSVGPVGMPVPVMVPPYKIKDIEQIAKRVGLDLEVMMENVQDYIDAEEGLQPLNDGFGWTRYHNLDEINQWLRNLTLQYEDILQLIQVNSTYEGRTIYGVRLAYNESLVNRTVFIESNIHAREWITSATTTYILNELLTSTNSTVRWLAQNHIWYFFPVFNPDGFEYSHTTDRMWRKTRVPHSVLCAGADPNRNWGHFWNHGGTSNSPCTQIYRGPAPFSEPSCRVMAEFIESVGDELVAFISFHSFSQLLLIPYGYTAEHLDNYDEIYRIGLRSAEALARRYGTQYTVGTVYDTIYQASGSSSDWVKGTFGTPIVYTYELRDLGQFGFLLPPEQIVPTSEETMDSIITIFEEYYANNTFKNEF